MSKVTDPDTLDRFQVCVDPVAETISMRGLGTERHAVDSTGDSAGTTTFTDAGANFTTDGVIVGDVLTIISDPGNNGGIIGHYRVASGIGTTTLVVERSIPASTAADLTYKINAKQTTGSASPQVADGVNVQALFSFLKEEWITLAGGLGNAVDLNKFDFPIVAISSAAGQYILGGVNGDAASAWKFNDTNGRETADTEGTTRELLRDGGWQERNASNIVLREYANITTLGALDTDAQPYFQQGDVTGTPTNFRLTGPANQAILTFGPDVGPHGTGLAFAATTITRDDGGSWTTDNYRLGDYVFIRSAEDGGNNGSFGPITTITGTVLTVASATWTVNTDDTAAIVQVDHRRYTKLFARKKGRSYTSAVHADAGIPTTGILALVSKFPLAHANDPAIALDDGLISGGDGTAAGDIFQANESHQAAANGVTTSLGNGTFTFASAAATFNSTARGSVVVLQAGDSLAITSGGYQGVYEIISIDSATQLTCFLEPLRAYPGNETTLSYTVRTGVRDVGAANATLANVSGVTGTLTSAGSTFDVNTALGDRLVVAGDYVQVFAGTGAVIGYYKVISVDSATVLTLNTSDQIFGGQTSQSYRIWRPGMFLQRFRTVATAAGMSNGLNFNGAGNPDTMTRTGGSWVTDGFLAGMAIQIVNAEDAANIGYFIIGPTPSATVVTLIASESLTTNTDDDTAINGNVLGDTGVTRSINSVVYPFHWRLFANAGNLSQVFQFLQRELRRATDIDGGNGTERGDITNLLMSFVSPNGVTFDLFPDDISTAELNNVSYTDIASDVRNNAFLVGITFDVNANIISSATKRLVAYFTSVPSGSFGTNAAVVVDNASGADMDFTSIPGDIQSTFDYTNNSQGGRTPNTDAAVTVVALGNNLAQHILTTALITKVNSVVISVQPPIELNYANP
jgi:hypothetical protein